MVDPSPSRSTNKTANTPILVTGAHRTGTTWVGKMLAAGAGSAYISEPLNVLHRPGVLRVPTRHWYTYLCPDNEAEYLPALRETFACRYHLGRELLSLRSVKDVGRMLRDIRVFSRGRLDRARAVVKDPFAVFSAGWFATRLGCAVVFTVRHPAGFASSLKRLNWPFDFSDLLAQPLLMRDWLEPFRGEMEAMQRATPDIIGQASLLWRMIYTAVRKQQLEFPEFLLVRHEDLSLDPEEGFRTLYAALDLQYTPAVAAEITASSGNQNPGELPRGKTHSVHLDSRANLHNWKRRLDKDEIREIRAATETVADHFYPEISWD